MVDGREFFTVALAAVQEVEGTQMGAIERAAEILAERLMRGGVGQVFGTGHSRAFAMEMAGRAGGLVPMHSMLMEDLALEGLRSVQEVQDPTLERDPEVARQLLGLYDVRPEDAFIVVSNSGRNGAVVEMAIRARDHAHPVIAVTSRQHTERSRSRHPSGKRLFEVADVVIDNRTPFGDAVLEAGPGVTVCALSSVTGAFIAQALTAEIVRRYLAAGRQPPVLISANVDGSDDHNQALRERYAGRISL